MSEAFWTIVDGHGLDGIPSDEPEALRMICTRLVRAEAENSRLRAVASAAEDWRAARLAACAAPIGKGEVWTTLGAAETALSATLIP